MATEGFEIIDGHRYYVKRNDKGEIVSQAAADPQPDPEPPSREENEARQVLSKDPLTWTPVDRDRLLRIIALRVLGRR